MTREEYVKVNFKAFMEYFIEEDDGFFESLKDEVEKGDHSPFNEDFR